MAHGVLVRLMLARSFMIHVCCSLPASKSCSVDMSVTWTLPKSKEYHGDWGPSWLGRWNRFSCGMPHSPAESVLLKKEYDTGQSTSWLPAVPTSA